VSLERGNPIPVGRYWIDVFEPNIALFNEWAKRNNPHIINREHFEQTWGMTDPTLYPARDWILFELSAPAPRWDNKLGFPNKATGGISTSDDTVQKPIVADPLDALMHPLEHAGWWVLGIGAAVGIWWLRRK
jgi:hypothetical protein